MEFAVSPILVLLIALTLLLPIGLGHVIFGRKRRTHVILGIVFIAISILPCLIMAPVCLWKFDALRGWSLCLSTDVPPYAVSLVQTPDGDFYRSYLEVTRSDGKKARVWIDAGDSRWWNPNIVVREDKTYFVRGPGTVDDRTTYVDAAHDAVYSSYHQEMHRLSELEFN